MFEYYQKIKFSNDSIYIFITSIKIVAKYVVIINVIGLNKPHYLRKWKEFYKTRIRN